MSEVTVPGTALIRWRRPGRFAIGIALLVGVVAIIVFNEPLRALEASLFAPVVSLVTGGHDAVAAGSIVWFARGTAQPFGLRVTAECTTTLLMIPLTVMLAGFIIFSKIALSRAILALATGTALLLLTNAIRVAGVAWATWVWGPGRGYTYSHLVVGSAFALIGFVGSMLATIWVLLRGIRRARTGEPGS